MTTKIRFHDNKPLSFIVTALAILALIVEIVYLSTSTLGVQESGFLLFFSVLTIILLLLRKFSFTLMFLLSTFTMIAAWRLSALANFEWVAVVYGLGVAVKLITYIYCAYENIIVARQHPEIVEHRVSVYEWQLFFVRLFIGFDLIPHFCEKLFAGAVVRSDDIQAFTQLGVHNPTTMVLIAGVIEFAGAIAIGCGFLTRLGAVLFVVYLLDATYLGHHFTNGFIWADSGGGWEYPVLWSTLILSFAVFGAGEFSIDRVLKDNYKLPMWLRHLMGGRAS